MLQHAALFENAAVYFFERVGYLGRVGVDDNILQYLFFSFGLKYLFSDSGFKGADMLSAMQSFAEEVG